MPPRRMKANPGEVIQEVAYTPVRTAAFRRWFKGSKVVDEDGQPLVVWHGHPASLDTFYVFDFVRASDIGMHFGTRKAAEQAGGFRSTVRPFYLSIQNPFVAYDPGDWIAGNPGLMQNPPILDQMATQGLLTRDQYDALNDTILALSRRAGTKDPRFVGKSDALWKAYRSDASELLRTALEASGFDGIVYKNETEDRGSTSWVAFRPGQIKSADENDGGFDASNPDVRKNPRGRR